MRNIQQGKNLKYIKALGYILPSAKKFKTMLIY